MLMNIKKSFTAGQIHSFQQRPTKQDTKNFKKIKAIFKDRVTEQKFYFIQQEVNILMSFFSFKKIIISGLKKLENGNIAVKLPDSPSF